MNAVPHTELIAAADKLLAEQTATHVRVEPAAGPSHRKAAVVITKDQWDFIRSVAKARGIDLAEDCLCLGREEACRLAAALRQEKEPGRALHRVLGVLHLGCGVCVNGVRA
jgi:hypothetical protein